jgi:magnesium transporter
MSHDIDTATPWTELEKIVDSGNVDHLQAFLQLLSPADSPYTITRLSQERQNRLFELIDPDLAADLMDQLEDEQVADVIEDLPAATAAAIVDEMDSDEAADVLAELDSDDAEAILERMDPEDAEDARLLARYQEDTAGGVMYTEYLSYSEDTPIDTVINALREHAKEYEEYDVHYFYVTGSDSKLIGIVRLRDLVLADGEQLLESIMIREPISVHVNTKIADLEDLFDRYSFPVVPVVEQDGELVGVASRAAVEEELGEEAGENFAKFGGIIGGEELRSMSLHSRVLRRLAFLTPNIPLFLMSVSVIAFYEDVIEKVVVLAAFLPLVAGMSGAAGNQSIAVSIRELSLGLLKPGDMFRVLKKELALGLVNGLVMGIVVGLTAWLFTVMMTGEDQPRMGLVVGGAIAVNSVIAVLLGASVPLMLKKWGIDPAMLAAPVLMTIIDMAGFFIVLNLAMVLIM